MSARLLCRLPPDGALAYDVASAEVFLGRDADRGVVIPVSGVSRIHACLTFDGKSHWLEDLGSLNGTHLNGKRVKREKLRHLDVIGLGDKIDLIFVLHADEPSASLPIVRVALTPESGPPHEIPVGGTVIGRSHECGVVLTNGLASKEHARIHRTETQLVLTDLGSNNGSFVNDLRMGVAVLRHGDRLLLGIETLTVVIERGVAAPPPAPPEAPQ